MRHHRGVPRRVSDFRGLAESSRVRLLGAVQTRPDSTLKELADQVGLHVNTVRDHLRALEHEGFVFSRRLATGTRGRPPLVYAPVADASTNPAAQERVDGATERGDELRRRLPEVTRRPRSTSRGRTGWRSPPTGS